MEANVSKFGSAEPDTIWDKYNERQQVISKAAAYIEKKELLLQHHRKCV